MAYRRWRDARAAHAHALCALASSRSSLFLFLLWIMDVYAYVLHVHGAASYSFSKSTLYSSSTRSYYLVFPAAAGSAVQQVLQVWFAGRRMQGGAGRFGFEVEVEC